MFGFHQRCRPASVRKAAFHLVLAGLRYHSAKQRRLSIHCYKQVRRMCQLTVFGAPPLCTAAQVSLAAWQRMQEPNCKGLYRVHAAVLATIPSGQQLLFS
jgi:hypothetical protein